jgi:hypothetical protein
MGRRSRPRAVLDRDQAAALHCLVEAFGIEQVIVTGVQASQSAGQALTSTATPAQAVLLEEAS